jgi:hypothetical protein
MRFSLAVFSAILAIHHPLAHASEIIQATDYHAHEARVDTNGNWLALQRVDEHWQLVSVIPQFALVDDAILGPKEGIRVSTNISNANILLMDESLKPGPVESSLKGHPAEMTTPQDYEDSRLPDVGQTRALSLNKQQYVLKNIAGEIVLESQGLTQKLFSYSEAGDTNAYILWIGDLDNDGKIDLIVDASDHYNAGELRLYLSSTAPKGSLVKLVARRRTTGC